MKNKGHIQYAFESFSEIFPLSGNALDTYALLVTRIHMPNPCLYCMSDRDSKLSDELTHSRGTV